MPPEASPAADSSNSAPDANPDPHSSPQADPPILSREAEVQAAFALVEGVPDTPHEPGTPAPRTDGDLKPKADAKDSKKAAPKEEPKLPEKDPASKMWARAMRVEKEGRQHLKRAKDDSQRAEQLRKELETSTKGAAELADLAKANPIAFLEKQGIDYASAFQAWTKSIKDGKDPAGQQQSFAEAKLLKEVEGLRQTVADNQKKTEDHNKTLEEARVDAEQQTQADDWIADANTMLGGEEYEAIRALGAEEQVPKYAGMYLEKTGKLLTQKEAADTMLVESVSSLKSILEAIESSESLQKLLGARIVRNGDGSQDPKAGSKQKKHSPEATDGPGTSTQDLAAGSDLADPEADVVPLHEEVRRATALLRPM